MQYVRLLSITFKGLLFKEAVLSGTLERALKLLGLSSQTFRTTLARESHFSSFMATGGNVIPGNTFCIQTL